MQFSTTGSSIILLWSPCKVYGPTGLMSTCVILWIVAYFAYHHGMQQLMHIIHSDTERSCCHQWWMLLTVNLLVGHPLYCMNSQN